MADGDGSCGGMERRLAQARSLVPEAIESARAARCFTGRWKMMATKLERIPLCLSDLSSHPFFARHTLCFEMLLSLSTILTDCIELAGRCRCDDPPTGKLRTQSDIDALSGRLDLSLRDSSLLLKAGMLTATEGTDPPEPEKENENQKQKQKKSVRELLARIQIGGADAKHRALDGLIDALQEEENSVFAAVSRSGVASIIRLLSASSPPVKEKAAAVICTLAESGACDHLLTTDESLPPLIRLAESSSSVCREKALVALQRLSLSPDPARQIVAHGCARPLIEISASGGEEPLLQSTATAALRNLCAVPEVRQRLSDEGIARAMIGLLNSSAGPGSREKAAECLQYLTSGNESLKREVIAEGGLPALLSHLDSPSPQEPSMAAVRNMVGSTAVAVSSFASLNLLPRLAHVLQHGSPGAQQAAASTVCRISSTAEMKRWVGESAVLGLIIGMLDAKTNPAREVAAQAIAGLVTHPWNCREIKREEKSVPCLVRLLDPGPRNSAKKYAVSALLHLSSSKSSRKAMIAYGAIGYLKKLSEMEVAGAKKLLDRLQRGKIRNFFTRK